MHREAGVVRVPCVIRQAGVARIVSVTEPRRSAGARGAFPLSLRWQTILAAGGNTARRQFALGELRAVIGRIRPAHAGNRTAQIAREEAWVRVHDRQVFSLSHFIFPDPKAAAQCHGRLRAVVDAPVLLIGGAAHRESIGRDEDHVCGRALQ